MKVNDFSIRVIKKVYQTVSNKKFYPPECDCDRQSSNDKIFSLLSTGKPCMISRFGTTEINCLNNFLCINDSSHSYLKKIWNYISDKTHTPWWNETIFHKLYVLSGVFPLTQETAEKFSIRYLQDIPEIDLLGCHQYYEKFMPLREDVVKVQLEMLYPFYVMQPWTRALKGKNVLVVHPFVESIQKQYKRRQFLFDNPDILPDFNLITLKAVQSIGGNCSEYASWFDALKAMEEQISQIDFDICILGCGAYGLPLAAHVKRLGKQAVHLGGGTQLLFGILGKRWLDQYQDVWHYRPGIDININYRPLFNENWISPLKSETPDNAIKVENACYW